MGCPPNGGQPYYQQQAMPQPFMGSPARPAPRAVRPQKPDEPLRAAPVVSQVAIPSPEEAGVSMPSVAAPKGAVDWNATHKQLAALSATGFGLVPAAGGQAFFIVLPNGKRVEGEGRDGAEAVAVALDRARRAR